MEKPIHNKAFRNNFKFPECLKISEARTDAIIKAIAAHPYLFALACCLLLNPFYFGQYEVIPENAYSLECIIAFAGISFIIYRFYKSGKLSRKLSACAVAVSGILIIILMQNYFFQYVQQYKWNFVSGCLILLLLYFCFQTKNYKQQLTSLLIMGTSFLLKFSYVFYTSISTRQNDVGKFSGNDSHAGYINYFLKNFSLPNFDPREKWQFCHPPLHHIISAVWISINENIFNISEQAAQESLQTLTLFYSMAIVISAYKILRHFKLNGKALYIPLLIIAFHPTFILYSGAINNDVLSVAFIMGAVVCTLKWYENQTMKNILEIALCIGLGMMTKMSAALVAPSVAIVFLVVFIKKIKTSWKKLLGQFAAFGGVCIPLGLWFSVRNYIKWGIPLNYVHIPGVNTPEYITPIVQLQYLGNKSFLSRITDFSSSYFSTPFINHRLYNSEHIVYGFNENNPVIVLMKTSLFNEFIDKSYFTSHPFILKLTYVFFWLAVFLAAAAFVFMIVSLFRKGTMKPLEKVFLISYYGVLMVNFYIFAYEYPWVCSMNFRYITPTLVITCLFTGIFLQNMKKKKSVVCNVITRTMEISAFAFAILSSVIFLALGDSYR